MIQMEASLEEFEALLHMLPPEARMEVVFDSLHGIVVIPDKYADQVDVAHTNLEPGINRHLIEYAANKRFEFETGGITVGDVAVPTDRLGRNALNLYQAVKSPVAWKGIDGSWHTLSAKQIGEIAGAVATHVQHAFAVEADIIEKIKSKKITSTAEIDDAFKG